MKSGKTKPIKILVLGSSGMAGHTIVKYLSENPLFRVYTYKRSNSKESISKTIEDVDFSICDIWPDYVINCIGLIKQREGGLVDHLETNGMFPIWLTQHLRRLK